MTQQRNENIRFLRNLRAVRDYTSDPIPDEVIRDLIEVGRWSGSASNVQATELVVVRDSAIKQRMSELGARPAASAAVVLVIVTPGNTERHDLEVFDNGRLVERLLLAAKAVGLGSNIATLKEEGPEVIKEALGIPAERRIWTVVTLGYPDEAAHKARPKSPTAGRKPSEAFVHWDRYG
ncbi:MAG TPA: nitroreductase family protein [Dehalococcoidia bacterium]|nr:nitroreductase family protein [Dehalococcoidia bacterium]